MLSARSGIGPCSAAGPRPWTGTVNTLSLDGSIPLQTIDGFGVNINAASWDNGNAQVWIAKMVQEAGVALWRVIVEEGDWEQTNDDSDPVNANWTAYDAIYSGTKFENAWQMIAYLNTLGVTDGITLAIMGQSCARLGGTTLDVAQKDEWVEQVCTMAYYGLVRRSVPVQFGGFSPSNEPDNDQYEGMRMGSSDAADVIDRVATKLGAMGFSTLRINGPECAFLNNSVTYIGAFAAKSGLMSRVTWFSAHNYSGLTTGVAAAAASAGKRWGMGEVGNVAQALSALEDGASAVLLFEAIDSVYNHAIRRGDGTTPPNDELGGFPSPISWNGTTYAARDPQYYDLAHMCRGIAAGAVYLGKFTTGNVTAYAFRHVASGRVTLHGTNTGGAVLLRISLANIKVPSTVQHFATTSSVKFQEQPYSVAIANGKIEAALLASSTFTITGA